MSHVIQSSSICYRLLRNGYHFAYQVLHLMYGWSCFLHHMCFVLFACVCCENHVVEINISCIRIPPTEPWTFLCFACKEKLVWVVTNFGYLDVSPFAVKTIFILEFYAFTVQFRFFEWNTHFRKKIWDFWVCVCLDSERIRCLFTWIV